MTNAKHQKYASGFEGKRWILQGLFWGGSMFIFMGILFPMAEKKAITWTGAGTKLALWLIAGLVYGLIMKAYYARQAKKRAAREGSANA